MTNEDKKGYAYCFAAGSVIIAICFLFYMFGGSAKDRTELQKNTDRTMAELNIQHQLTRSQLDYGAGHVDAAGNALERALAIVNQCQRRIEYGKARIKECQDIIEESRRSLEEAKRIISIVEGSDRNGKEGVGQEGKRSLP